MTNKVAKGSVVVDGMSNVIAGLGAANPKLSHSYIVDSNPVMLEQTYRGSTWFRRIVDGPPSDAVRKWRQWNAKAEQTEKIEALEKRLNVRRKVRDALVLQRLFGGSVIIPLGLQGDSTKELNLDSVRAGHLKGLTVLNRYQIQTEGRITDVLSPWYGCPEFYVVANPNGQDLKLHPSRVIRFSDQAAISETNADGWGDSIWLRMADSIQGSETGGAVLAALLVESKLDVMRIPDLTNNMATEKAEQALIRRFQLATQLKSVANTLIMDKDDEFEQKTFSFSSIPDSVMLLLQIMCGAAGYPATKLLGTQAKGLSNGGDVDLKNYYDEINVFQELDLDPAMEPLNEMLIRSALGVRDESIWHEWSPLYSMSEKEEAEVEKTFADTTEKLVNTGLFAPEVLFAAVSDRMVNSGSWPALEKALEENQKATEEALAGNNGAEEIDPENDPVVGTKAQQEREEQAATDAVMDATPRTLYVHRKLLNGSAVLDWARSQGFKELVDPETMHVTICYSKVPLDWMKVGEDWNPTDRDTGNLRVGVGGPRLVEAFGDEGKAMVLLFTSDALKWRHDQIMRAGAEHSHDEYQPHVTFSWAGLPEGVDLESIEAYQGELLFGPEIFQKVDEDWKAKVGVQ